VPASRDRRETPQEVPYLDKRKHAQKRLTTKSKGLWQTVLDFQELGVITESGAFGGTYGLGLIPEADQTRLGHRPTLNIDAQGKSQTTGFVVEKSTRRCFGVASSSLAAPHIPNNEMLS
jgi:hypothetical protein